MTISIFMPSWGIEGKENNTLETDLKKIFIDNGAQVNELLVESVKHGKKVTVEIENLYDEKQVTENISKIKYNNKLELRPEFYHEIIINNIPECSEEDIKQECEKVGKCKCISVRITDKIPKRAFVKLESRDVAENLIASLNNQEWHKKTLQVKLNQKSLNKQREKNNLESQIDLYKTPANADLNSIGEFYNNSDYDLVTQNLKIFISEICKYLSNPPSN